MTVTRHLPIASVPARPPTDMTPETAPPAEPVAWKQVGSLALIIAGVWTPLALALLLA